MAWRDDIKGPASFRGAEFFVEVAERVGGRRTVRHEYPFRDRPFFEDMGRAARGFSVDGYVLGPEYVSARNALLGALEGEGPGQLIHPYYGRRQVICTSFRVRESSADGGIARFAIDFDETDSAPEAPVVTVAAGPAVVSSADATIAKIRARLALEAELALPSSSLASVADVVASGAQALGTVLAPVMAGTQEAAALSHGLDNLLLDVASLARQPAGALDAYLGMFDALASVPALFGVRACLAAFAFAPIVERPPATTSNRRREQEVYDLLLWALRAAAAAQAARLAPSAVFDTYDAAVSTRQGIVDALEASLDGADDDSFAALEQLQADLVRAVPGEASDLPRLLRYTPPATVPSLVLAHRLYGDIALEADLVARNRLARPGFILGGAALEVLSDAA